MSRIWLSLAALLPAHFPLAGTQTTAAPRTEEVVRAPFRILHEAVGVFEQADPAVVRFAPESDIGPVFVASVAAELTAAAPIRKGQVLFELAAPELPRRITETETEVQLGQFALERARAEFARAQELDAILLRESARALTAAQTALDRLRDIDIPDRKFRSRYAVDHWDVARREAEDSFQILKNLYEQDLELEPTEKLDLESQSRRLQMARLDRPRQLAKQRILEEQTLPRQLAAAELAVEKARHRLDTESARVASEAVLGPLRIAQRERELADLHEQIEHLRAAERALIVRAPAHGFAFAGHYEGEWRFLRGRAWQPQDRVASGEVLITVVQAAPKRVSLDVPEGFCALLRTGTAATLIPHALPPGAPLRSLPAEVVRVDPVVRAGSCRVELLARKRHARLFPGHRCQVFLNLYEQPAALTVARTAIHREGEQTWVELWSNNTRVRRDVVVGVEDVERVEILSGLEPGERVVLLP